MKTIICLFLVCFCFIAMAQEMNYATSVKLNVKNSLNFFSINTSHLPEWEKTGIDLKLPSIYILGPFRTKDNWVMPTQDLDMICPPGGSRINGFMGFQSVNTINLFNAKAVSRFTFDTMGNLVNSELTFGGF